MFVFAKVGQRKIHKYFPKLVKDMLLQMKTCMKYISNQSLNTTTATLALKREMEQNFQILHDESDVQLRLSTSSNGFYRVYMYTQSSCVYGVR